MVGAGLVLAAAMTLPGCTEVQKQGLAASYLIVDSMQAAPGAEPTKLGGSLASDVFNKKLGIVADGGQIQLRLALRDPGTLTSPLEPSSTNTITVNRYHVRYIRSDGHNVQGVDVPFEFDGASTVSVGSAGATLTLTLVRVQAKVEAPLSALANNGGAQMISTIAEVTLYGTDQAGREVSVVATISVNFADWADPA
jgi:hypothetical protein